MFSLFLYRVNQIVGIMGTYSSELWEPIYLVGIVGKSCFLLF
jgi:hypothetical protein